MVKDPAEDFRRELREEYQFRLELVQRVSRLEERQGMMIQRWQYWVGIGGAVIAAIILKFVKV